MLFISNWNAQEGAFGLVLNRPAGRTVAELLPQRDDLGSLGHLPVFLGGPVSRDQLIFASFHWQPATGELECQHHVSLSAAEEIVQESGGVVRAFIGYAGWSKGQLEGELAQQAWLLKKPDAEVLEEEPDLTFWRKLLGTFGPKYRLIADAPEDPSLN